MTEYEHLVQEGEYMLFQDTCQNHKEDKMRS